MATPLPKASPDPQFDEKASTTRHPTGEIQAVVTEAKKAKKRRPLIVTLVGLLGTASTGLGGYGLHKSGTVDDSNRDRMVKVEQRLVDHIEAEKDKHDDLKVRTDRLERGQRRMERKIDRTSATNELVLDALKVSKAKRPPEVEADADEQ